MRRSLKISRVGYLLLGLGSLGLGFIGAILPVMPSTCFFILAAYFFGQSSERLEAWVLNHPRFGGTVRAWRRHRAISFPGKCAALSGMCGGLILLWLSQAPIWVLMAGTAFIIASAYYVATRPTYRVGGVLSDR